MNKILGLPAAGMLAVPIKRLQHDGVWMRIDLEWIVTVLIALIVITSTLLACLVYLFIWLSERSRPLIRYKSPVSSVEVSGEKYTRRYRFTDSARGK